MDKEKADMIIYTTEDGLTKVETTFDGDTVWLSIDQMAELFQRDKSTISRHIKNVFTEGELQRDSVVAKFATTATDGKVYKVDYYNLDVIISVGYRVKSKRGIQFRIWATGILKEYMRKGFALDDDCLKNLGGGLCLNLDIGREQTNQLVNGSGHISLVVHSGTHSCKQMGIGRCNDFFVCQVKRADKSCLQL